MWTHGRSVSGLLVVISVTAVTALTGCGPGSAAGGSGLDSPTGQVSIADSTTGAPSVEEVVATAQRSMRAGGVLHETVTETQDAGSRSYSMTRDLWLDGTRDAVRETRTFSPEGEGLTTQHDRMLAVDGVLWSNGEMLATAVTCYGGGVAVSALLGCPGFTADESTVSARLGTWHETPVVVLLFHRVSSGEDTTETVDGREFLDASTGMPLAREEAGNITGDGTFALHRTTTFAGGFVDASAVAADFFDPESLGWHVPDPETDLPTDVPVYWLGRTFNPGGGLPALRFAGVENAGAGGPGYATILKYNAADEPAGPPMLTIQVWTKAALDASHIVWGSCASQNYSDGPLQIAIRCPNVSVRRAEVRTGESFMLLDAPGVATGSKLSASPYNTPEALLTAARGLTLWQQPGSARQP